MGVGRVAMEGGMLARGIVEDEGMQAGGMQSLRVPGRGMVE